MSDNKPPMFGPSAVIDPATCKPRAGKSALHCHLLGQQQGKPLYFDFHTDDVGHTVIMAPTRTGMSVLSDVLVEECKRHGAKLGVVDVGYSYSRTKED